MSADGLQLTADWVVSQFEIAGTGGWLQDVAGYWGD
jgi:hypothetical protein